VAKCSAGSTCGSIRSPVPLQRSTWRCNHDHRKQNAGIADCRGNGGAGRGHRVERGQDSGRAGPLQELRRQAAQEAERRRHPEKNAEACSASETVRRKRKRHRQPGAVPIINPLRPRPARSRRSGRRPTRTWSRICATSYGWARSRVRFSIALTKGSSCSQSGTLRKCCWTFGSATTPWTSHYEAPTPIDQKAEPATAGRSRKTAEAVTNKGAGLGPRLNPVNIDPKNGAAAQKRSF
jgi:hypothetical protein